MILALDQLAAEADDEFLDGDTLLLIDDDDEAFAELDRASVGTPEIALG